MRISSEQLEELKELAADATPGPWGWRGKGQHEHRAVGPKKGNVVFTIPARLRGHPVGGYNVFPGRNEVNNALYLANCEPGRIIAIIDDLQETSALLREALGLLEEFVEMADHDVRLSEEESAAFEARIRNLLAEAREVKP